MENFREGEEMEKRECKIRRQGREHWKQGQGVNRLKKHVTGTYWVNAGFFGQLPFPAIGIVQ